MLVRALAVTLVLTVTHTASARPSPSPVPKAFDPDSAKPYFSDGDAADAARKLRLQEWAQAARGFADYLANHGKAKDAAQAGFLRAWAELKAGQHDAAAQHFDALVEKYSLLAEYCRAWGARAHLLAGRAKEALTRAKRVPSTSVLDGEARLLRAEAERALGRDAAAADEYAGYLSAYPTSWRAAEVRFKLGEALVGAGRTSDAEAAFRRVYLEAPHESWGAKAEARLSETSRKFEAPELAQRAMALFDGMRNVESEAEWGRVLGAPKLTDELACTARYHLAQSVFKQRERPRAAPLFDAAVEACEKAKNGDLTTKALYQGARAWGNKGDKDVPGVQKAIALLERVSKEFRSHSFADDAQLRAAENWEVLKDDARVDALLKSLPENFPSGDQRGEALWRLAFRAWKKNDLESAKKWLELKLSVLPREDGWWEAGRTLYWLGRAAEKANQLDEAQARWTRCAREYPLSYYSLSALSRLRDRWPEKAQALVEELTREGKDAGWSFKPRALFGSEGFLRGVELARLGLAAEAKRELVAAGLPSAKKNDKVANSDEEELLWLASVLYDRAGEVVVSHAIPRHVLTEYSRAWPVGDNAKKWRLAYPRGYADLIEKHATANSVPPALQFAIVREESAFDPLLESFANAVGLTQLTAAPAKRFAEGLPHDRQALRDPVINVTIGARELAHCYKLHGHAALAIAAYNAGDGAVGRWRRDPERAQMALDEFVEAIPYDETRGYTKRVLSSFFAYTWLAASTNKLDDRVPPLPLTFSAPGKK